MPTTTPASTSGSAPIRRCAGGSITTRPRSSRPRCARSSSASTCRPGSSIRTRRRARASSPARSPRAGNGAARRTSSTPSTWADKIDAAQFASAEEAIALERARPAPRRVARARPDAARHRALRRVALARLARRGRRASRGRAAARRGRDRARARARGVKKLGVWHGDVIVFDRFDDVGARSPGFLGYLLFPTCLYADLRHAERPDDQDLRRREPVDEGEARATTSASCARASAAAVTPSSAASRCAATSSSARARRSKQLVVELTKH